MLFELLKLIPGGPAIASRIQAGLVRAEAIAAKLEAELDKIEQVANASLGVEKATPGSVLPDPIAPTA